MSKTPCEKLGYKVGDKFEVVDAPKGSDFSSGSIIELHKDDDSDVPLFKSIEGACQCKHSVGYSAYLELRYVRPLQEPIEPAETDELVTTNYPTENFKISLKDMSEAEKGITKEWLKEVAKSRGFNYRDLAVRSNFYWMDSVRSSVNWGNNEVFFQRDPTPELTLTFETAITGFNIPGKKSKKELQLEELVSKISKQLEEAQSELSKINSKG